MRASQRTARPLARSWVAVLIVLILVAFSATSCSDSGGGVDFGTAGRADVVEVVDAPASVTARAVATLSAPADGTLAAVYVAPGASVVAGQELAVIDSPSAQQRLADAEAALEALDQGGSGRVARTDLSGMQRRTDEAAAAAFTSARDSAGWVTDVQLREALLARVAAAETVYREAAASARALIASVQRGLVTVSQAMSALTAAQRAQAQSAYNLAKSTVDALVLKAPVSGLVQMGGPSPVGANGNMAALAAAASGGSSLSSGSQPGGAGADPAPAVGAKVAAGTTVLTVVDVAELGLLAAVDETDVLLVTPGQSASVELDAAPGAQYRGTVRSVDVLPSASSGDVVSYRVRLTLSAGTQPDGSAAPTPRPGMSAVAHLEVRSATNAVVVPAPAVFRADGQDAVWAVRGGKAQRVAVTVGVPGQGLVEIVSGLSEGERVVIRGTDRVRSGQMMP